MRPVIAALNDMDRDIGHGDARTARHWTSPGRWMLILGRETWSGPYFLFRSPASARSSPRHRARRVDHPRDDTAQGSAPGADITPGRLAVHADRDGVVEKQTGERGAGELAALIGAVMRCVCGAVCEQCLPLLSFLVDLNRVGRLNRR